MQGCHEGSVALSSFSANKNKGLGATKGLTMVRHKGGEGVAVALFVWREVKGCAKLVQPGVGVFGAVYTYNTAKR